MPHTLGLHDESGLGLVGNVNPRPGLGLVSPRADAGVIRETSAAAPVVGVERTEIGSPADRRQRAPAPAPAPAPARPDATAPKSRIPKFADDPLRTIAFALSEAALAFAGQPTNLPRLLRLESEDEARAEAQAFRQQSLKLRKDAQVFDAIKFGAEQLEGKSGDEADAVIATVENVVPEAAGVLKAMAKAGAEKSQALLEMFTENPRIFPGASDVAQALGAERTMELFGPIAVALAEQKALAPGRIAEAGAKAEVMRVSIGRIAAEAAARREPLEQAILRAGALATAQREPIAEAAARGRAIAEAQRESIADAAKRAQAISAAQRIPLEQAIDREVALSAARREPIEDAAVRAAVAAAANREPIGDAAARAGAITAATEGAKAEFREPKGKAVNILLPDGRRATGRELPSGELMIVGDGGALVSAPPGALKMTLQAAPGELPDAALNRKVVQTETTTRNFVRMALETVKFLQDPKTVLGGAGSGLRFAQGLKAEASQLARAFSSEHFEGGTGKDLSVAEILNPQRYEFDGLQAIAAANVRIKANVVAMAYILARARDPSGRLSDFDVQASMETLGFQSNDKAIMAATISDRVREVTENSTNFIESATGKRPNLPTLPPAPARASQGPKVFTIEELEALSRGSN